MQRPLSPVATSHPGTGRRAIDRAFGEVGSSAGSSVRRALVRRRGPSSAPVAAPQRERGKRPGRARAGYGYSNPPSWLARRGMPAAGGAGGSAPALLLHLVQERSSRVSRRFKLVRLECSCRRARLLHPTQINGSHRPSCGAGPRRCQRTSERSRLTHDGTTRCGNCTGFRIGVGWHRRSRRACR